MEDLGITPQLDLLHQRATYIRDTVRYKKGRSSSNEYDST